MKRQLRSVPKGDKPLDMAGDIYAADKKKIAARDWADFHVKADRRKPFETWGRRNG